MNDGKSEIGVMPQEIFMPVELIDRSGFVPRSGVKTIGRNLSEYITGIDCYENPETMSARLKWDHQRLKIKYGLPNQVEKYENPGKYIEKLRQIAEEKEIKIFGPLEYLDRYQKELTEGSTDDGDGIIYVKEDENDLVTAFRIEHEMVHAMQVENNDIKKGRPIEEMEYEAYVVANLNLKNLDKDPIGTFDYIFVLGLIRSCQDWYKKRGETGAWDRLMEVEKKDSQIEK